MRISDWSSDVCSSDLRVRQTTDIAHVTIECCQFTVEPAPLFDRRNPPLGRSEEHTSELQSLMRISYAVFCLKKKKQQHATKSTTHIHRPSDTGHIVCVQLPSSI